MTCSPWRKKYGGLRIDQARQLKELDDVLDQLADLFILRSKQYSISKGKLRDELLKLEIFDTLGGTSLCPPPKKPSLKSNGN